MPRPKSTKRRQPRPTSTTKPRGGRPKGSKNKAKIEATAESSKPDGMPMDEILGIVQAVKQVLRPTDPLANFIGKDVVVYVEGKPEDGTVLAVENGFLHLLLDTTNIQPPVPEGEGLLTIIATSTIERINVRVKVVREDQAAPTADPAADSAEVPPSSPCA